MLRPRTRRHGPTDEDLDEADDALDTTVVGEYDYDTPTVDELQQAETGFPDRPIPVRLVNPVNVNQLPTRLASMFSKGLAASPAGAVKVLNEDVRRASITIPSVGVVLAIGRSQAEANDVDAFRIEGNQGPYRFHFVEELWVRSTGAVARVSVAVEQWAR